MPVSRHPARASPSGPVARGRTIHSVRSGSPSGPFTTTWVAASNLSVGSGLVVIIFRWAHLTASARFRVRALGPVSGRLSIAISWRTDQVRWFPAAFRPPAFASRSSCSRRGVGPSSRSAYRTTGSDLDGVSAFRTHELRPGWAPSVPRGRRCSSRTGATTRPAPAASQRPVPPPRKPSHRRGSCLNQASTKGSHVFARPVFPSPVATRMERAALGLSPELRTPPTRSRTTHVGEGTGHRARTWNYSLNITSVDLQSGSSLVTCDLASHVAKA